MAGVDHHPDAGALGADGGHGAAEFMVNHRVPDRADGVLPRTDVDRQEDFLQPIRFGDGMGGGVDRRLLRAMAGEVDDNEIAGMRLVGQLGQRRENRGAGRHAVCALRRACLFQAIGQHGDVGARNADARQRLQHQRDVVARPGQLQVPDDRLGIIGNADQQRAPLRLGGAGAA